MSRSNKKAIIKDNPPTKALFRRKIRHRQNQETQQAKYLENTDEASLTSDKSIVNDYDYCDYVLDYENDRGFVKRWQKPKDFLNKLRRK